MSLCRKAEERRKEKRGEKVIYMYVCDYVYYCICMVYAYMHILYMYVYVYAYDSQNAEEQQLPCRSAPSINLLLLSHLLSYNV